jgi:uncharacterized protein (TIGR02145 family)
MKEPNQSIGHWYLPNLEATNSSGFTAFSGEKRLFDGLFSKLGTNALFSTSYEINNIYACEKSLSYNNKNLGTGYVNKNYGFSCRCFKKPVGY